MESANHHHHHHHHHHQLQDQLVGFSSSFLTASPHVWTQNITLSTGNPNSTGVSLIQDLGSQWNTNFNNTATLSLTKHTHHHDHDLQQLSKIKEEEQLSAACFPNFIEMLNTTSTAATIHQDSHYIKDEHSNYMADLSEKLLLKTISSGFNINGHRQFCGSLVHSSFGPSRGNFSQTCSSINISNLNRSPPPSITASYYMDLQALDPLTCKRFSGSLDQSCHDNLCVYEDNKVYDLDNLQQSDHFPSCCPNKISSFTTNEITEAKRPSSSLPEPKATVLQAPPKKSRLETRASSPQFKVRKEKLGDRIAALQQLVAPFGKTDTASVLMEAIGYIKFLQNQVEALSVPYMKSSRNKSSTSAQASQSSTVKEGTDEPRRDLRSRGLCLVPLSCMSYLTGGDGGGGIWPPSKYFGGL